MIFNVGGSSAASDLYKGQPLFTLTDAKPDAFFTTHVPSVYVLMFGDTPGSGVYAVSGLVTEA